MAVGKKRLGEILVEFGLLAADQLDVAIAHQADHPDTALGRAAVELGFCTEEVLLKALSLQIGLPAVHVREVNVPPDILQRVPAVMARELQVLPLAIVEDQGRNTLLLAMARPLDADALDAIRFVSKMRVLPLVAGDEGMRLAIERLYSLPTEAQKADLLDPEIELFDPELELSMLREIEMPEALQISPEELLRELG